MSNFIGRFLQRRREERIRAVAKWNKHQEWLQYMRRKGVIMPQPRPDERSSQELDARILGQQKRFGRQAI